MTTIFARLCLDSANRSNVLASLASSEDSRLYWEASAMKWMHLFRECLVE